MSSNELVLKIGGDKHGGWKRVRVSMGIEQLASGFSIGYTEQWLSNDQARAINEGDHCVVSIGGEDVIDGYVDTSDVDYDAHSHGLTVSGRTCTGDLVDCSAIHKTGQWKDRTITQIAEDLCKPFKVGVKAEADVGSALVRFSLQDGETVFEAINKLARMRGLLVVSDIGKNIVFTRAGKEKVSTKLELGKNIKRGGRSGSVRDRYSEYIVKGQVPGSDDFFGAKSATPKATVKDDGVPRYRPLIVMAEDSATGADLEKRAKWERNTRAGRDQRLRYTMPNTWRHDGGIWRPNVLVDVEDAFLGFSGELLVVRVTLADDRQGRRTELELTGKEAFDVLELPPPKPPKPKNKNKWSLW